MTSGSSEMTVKSVTPMWRMRMIAFYAVVAVLTFGLVFVEWWELILPALVWLPDSFINEFLAERVDQASIHRIHLMAKGLAHVLVAISLLVQLRRPAAREAPMWQVSAFFVMAIAVNLIAGNTTEAVPLMIWVIFGLGVLAGVLHPSSPMLKLPVPVDARLLALTGVMAVPFAIYATREVGLQISGTAADPHWTAVHYIFSAEIGFLLILTGFISSTEFTGRRLTAWMTGLAAVLMGLASVVYSDQASTLGIGWGSALIVWGIAFVVVSEWRQRPNQVLPAVHERVGSA
jgi:hypothetical protein